MKIEQMEDVWMKLMLKNQPVLNIEDNGICQILDFDRLPFALRKETGKSAGRSVLILHVKFRTLIEKRLQNQQRGV